MRRDSSPCSPQLPLRPQTRLWAINLSDTITAHLRDMDTCVPGIDKRVQILRAIAHRTRHMLRNA
jgi:hypothetical protein